MKLEIGMNVKIINNDGLGDEVIGEIIGFEWFFRKYIVVIKSANHGYIFHVPFKMLEPVDLSKELNI